MKAWWLVAILALAVSCSQGTSAANVQPHATPSPTPSASASSAASCQPSTSFGLLIVNRQLQLVDTCAQVRATTPISPSSVQSCTPGGEPANLAPPVSATADRIYYRDGDIQIKYLTPDGQTGDATTVPGSSTSVSFFSVSPDDKRIAVVTEDMSSANDFSLHMYVADVSGGGNRSDIYSAIIPKTGGNTLWPMGWHGGKLVLALIQACGTQTGGISPVEWHLVDPATGNRLVNITSLCDNVNPGVLSRWPSPAGVACMDFVFRIEFRDWSDSIFGSMSQYFNASSIQSGLSPSGKAFFMGNELAESYCPQGLAKACIGMVSAAGIGPLLPAASVPCLFIDEEHLLAPGGVIGLDGNVIGFATRGSCAGRFPGGL